MSLLKSKLLLAAALVCGGVSASAQQVTLGPEWGENATQEERYENAKQFNFYRDAYNLQRYDDALTYLPGLIENSPRGAQNIYVYAINIYKNKIQRSMDLEQRKVYVDSLFILYDLRMEYFGDDARYGRPYILVQKAKDYLNFSPMDRDGIREVFVEAIKANESAPDADFINLYFNELTTDYKNDLVETDYYLEQYDWLLGLMDKITDPAAKGAKDTFDALFVSSSAADCDNLERIFRGKIAATPSDVSVLTKAFSILVRNECYSDFTLEVGSKLFELEQTAENAHMVANAFIQAGKETEALDFLKAAFEKTTDPITRALFAIQIAGTELSMHNAAEAAQYARQARSLDPSNGYACIVLAQAYAEGASNCEGFDSQTVFWLAYDVLAAGRSLFEAGSAEQEQIDSTMAMFRRSFPTRDELFFRGLTQEGAAYDVNCGWVRGRTTVRIVD